MSYRMLVLDNRIGVVRMCVVGVDVRVMSNPSSVYDRERASSDQNLIMTGSNDPDFGVLVVVDVSVGGDVVVVVVSGVFVELLLAGLVMVGAKGRLTPRSAPQTASSSASVRVRRSVVVVR